METITKINLLAAIPALAVGTQSAVAAKAASTEGLGKPNVVWYMTEDTSPQYMGLYNNGKGGKSPNLEALAKDAVTYTNAFSNAPVSSAARTTLITGCYAPRFGGSLHRKLELKTMPDGLHMFPAYLRQAGYYTANASKTDYNVDVDKTAWSQIKGKIGDWRKRKSPDQPFFFVRTNGVTHESSLLFNEEVYKSKKTRTNPANVYIHPDLQDTKLMRYTYATFYDRIKDSDDEFGTLLAELKKDGLMDNTFVFYFGDNGGSLPHSKGYTNDVGFRVPLVIYVPEKWRAALGVKGGEECDGLVSFMDFGATVLNLAGVEIPEQMDGVPFLGDGSKRGAESTMCYGDRFDDLYAFNRSLYKGDFRYARNYQPYHPKGLFSYYRYKSLAFQESREMYLAGKLNKTQSRFFEPQAPEELFDLKNDPNELHNLATDPKYKSTLKKMRNELASTVIERCDLGFLPETIILEETMKMGQDNYGKAHKAELKRYRDLADLQMASYKAAEKSIASSLNSSDAVEQWWAINLASYYSNDVKNNKELVDAIKAQKGSGKRSFNRMAATVFLVKSGVAKVNAAEVKSMLKSSKTLAEVLLILNDLAYLHDAGLMKGVKLNLTNEMMPYTNTSVEARVLYLNK